MHEVAMLTDEQVSPLMITISRQAAVSEQMILPVAELIDCLAALFALAVDSKVVGAGLCTPEIAIAADRAGVEFDECPGGSPFSVTSGMLGGVLSTGREVVYVANPNHISGAEWSLADLETVSGMVPGGLVVLEECCVMSSGTSATRLLKRCPNLVIVRPLVSTNGKTVGEAGNSDTAFLMATPSLLNRLRRQAGVRPLSESIQARLSSMVEDSQALAFRRKLIQDEGERLCSQLATIGIDSRAASTGFILIRVANPAMVGNSLDRNRIRVQNLDGYPGMSGFVQYRMSHARHNDALLKAFQKMPKEYYEPPETPLSRRITLKRGEEDGVPRRFSRMSEKQLAAREANRANTELHNIKSCTSARPLKCSKGRLTAQRIAAGMQPAQVGHGKRGSK